MGLRNAGKSHEEARRESRARLLEAGAHLLREQAQRNPFAGLRVRGICERAGYSTGAFYVHWSDVDSYQLELAEYLLSEDESVADLAELERVADAVRGLPARAALTRLAQADIELLTQGATWDAVELLNVTWARDRLRDTAARGYRDVDERTAEAYAVVLAAAGREPRPPLTLRDIGVLLQGLVEGLGLRHKVDPEALAGPEGKVYATAVTALLAVLTRPVGDPATLDDVLEDAFGTGG